MRTLLTTLMILSVYLPGTPAAAMCAASTSAESGAGALCGSGNDYYTGCSHLYTGSC